MPDPIIVDVQGIGPVEFPAGTSGAQIESWVLNQIAQAKRAKQTWGEWVGNQIPRVGGGLVGGVIGTFLGGPGVGTFAGTATGAAMGDEWAQSREVAQGVRDAVNPLEMMAAGVTAPIPGATIGKGPLLRQVPKALAAAVPGAAASSAGLQLAESGTVDPWRTASDTGRGAGLGTLMGVGIPASLRAGQSKAAQKLGRDETGAIRVYHGSPHDFDQFSTEKIGTGEGAQAYGHGLYFAEQEGTAKVYRDALGGDAITFPDGDTQIFQRETPEGTAQFLLNAVSTSDRDVAATYQAARRELYEEIGRGLGKNNGRYERNLKALEVLDQWQEIGATPGRAGTMYEVDINADPEHFLDYDARFSEQSPAVREALASLGVRGDPDGPDWLSYTDAIRAAAPSSRAGQEAVALAKDMIAGRKPATGDAAVPLWKRLEQLAPGVDHNAIHDIPVTPERITGADLYERLSQHDRAAASAALKEAGIPGIKYLDQGSRRAGEGSRNYVVFDDKLVSILRKYGLLPFVPLSQVGRPQQQAERDRKK